MSGAASQPAILLGVGGGIAAFKAAALASRLVQDGYRVRVAMTRSAGEFVGAATFAGLTGQPVVVSTTQIDQDGSAPHIEATRSADLMVVAPATADLLGRVAAGLCDDPVALGVVACRCPVVVCPAMNDAMWESPAVQHNLATLKGRGIEVLGPAEGWLAEGYKAIGRMVEAEDIAAFVHQRVPLAGR